MVFKFTMFVQVGLHALKRQVLKFILFIPIFKIVRICFDQYCLIL